jgi:uncharacterized protein YdhG (YjbR/CyaY superfamily)
MKPQTHDEYLQNFTGAIRQTLNEIRALIRSLVPDAEAYIGYGIPAYRLKGKYLIGYGGAKQHCAIYPGSAILEAYREELAGFDTSKGALRLKPGEPLPTELLTKMILELQRDHLENAKS